MARYSGVVLRVFLCFVSIKGLQPAKLYLVEVPLTEDTNRNQDLRNFEISDYGKQILKLHDKKTEANYKTSVALCKRLFGKYNNDGYFRCLKAVKDRRDEHHVLESDSAYKSQPSPSDQVGRQKTFTDSTPFSKDYLDVTDLRSDFAGDDVNVGNLRSTLISVPECKYEVNEFGEITKTKCTPVSRKKLDIEDFGDGKFRVLSTSDESESKLKREILRKKKKNKRYKVISNENDKSVSESSEEKIDNSEENSGLVESNASIQLLESSIEITTKKPKKKNKKGKTGSTDGYLYLQGNNLYDQDDFRRNVMERLRTHGNYNGHTNNNNILSILRRGMRMAHFLPKRVYWDEDEYQNLGYYFFNGPKGKYQRWRAP